MEMDEFDIARFVEDESLLYELINGLLEQIRIPFIEQRLASGFKENLEDERDDLIKTVQKREEQISMLLQFFYSLTEVGITKIQELNQESSSINEEMQSSKVELQALENHIRKLQEQERILELGNERVEEEIEKLEKIYAKSRADAQKRRAEIEELLRDDKTVLDKTNEKTQSVNIIKNSTAQEQEIKKLQKKNMELEKEGWLLAEKINKHRLKKEQEDYYKELCEFTENELNQMRKVFDQDIPGYDEKIKKLREECVAMQLEIIELAPVDTTRNTVAHPYSNSKKSLADTTRKERNTFYELKRRENYAIEETEEPFATLPDETPKNGEKISLNEKVSESQPQKPSVLANAKFLDSESEDEGDDSDHERTESNRKELFSIEIMKKNEDHQNELKGIGDEGMKQEREPQDMLSVGKQKVKETERGSWKANNVAHGEDLLPDTSNSVTELHSKSTYSIQETSIKEHTAGIKKSIIEKISVATQTEMRSGESEDKKEEILAKTPINSTSRMQTSKNINESARRDPAKEFFAMTCQCAKLNSPFFDKISCFPTDHYYERLVQQKVPFNKWYKWIQRTLEAKVIHKKPSQAPTKLTK